MSAITLESLGLSKEELVERVVQRAAEDLLSSTFVGEEGEDGKQETELARRLTALVKQRVDEKVSEIASTFVLPKLDTFLANLVLQSHNQWGEKLGKPQTLVEYVVARADAYLHEEVDFNGVSQEEARARGNSWYGTGKARRLAFMVDKHMAYAIENGMKRALETINKAIVPALGETVRTQLAEIETKIQKALRV